MTPTTTRPDADRPERQPYVFPSMQAAWEIDPASVEVPVGAVDVRGPLVPGLLRPPLRPEFLRALERALVPDRRARYWPWGIPSDRYYSPNAVVALLSAERVEGWRSRVARQLHVPSAELRGPLAARQQSWYLDRQLEQLLDAERSADRLRGDPYWAALRRRPQRQAEDDLRHLLDATGTTAQRSNVAEVLAAHDGHYFLWSWHLHPEARRQVRQQVQGLDLAELRLRVEQAARLLRARPPDPSVALANLWGVRELLQEQARRGRARIEHRRSDGRALPALRLRARRRLRIEVDAEQARLDVLDECLQEIRGAQDRLDDLRTTRRAWESQPEHVEVLAWGELSAERLRLLEFGVVLRLEEDPPPYLQSTIGLPFAAEQRAGRRAWLKAAWTIERLRADRGVSDPDVALGLEPEQASARQLYDLAGQTLTMLGQNLRRLRAAADHPKEIAVDLAREPRARLLDDLGL